MLSFIAGEVETRTERIGTIMAYSNSRLTRRPLEWMEIIALADSGALEIETVVFGKHDFTTAEGRALALTVATEAIKMGHSSQGARRLANSLHPRFPLRTATRQNGELVKGTWTPIIHLKIVK